MVPSTAAVADAAAEIAAAAAVQACRTNERTVSSGVNGSTTADVVDSVR